VKKNLFKILMLVMISVVKILMLESYMIIVKIDVAILGKSMDELHEKLSSKKTVEVTHNLRAPSKIATSNNNGLKCMTCLLSHGVEMYTLFT
jgi:hypothetical protein